MYFFEDLTEGECWDLGSYHFSDDNIVRFAQKFDPQYFHLDAEKAKSSLFGGLSASGWHTAAVCMRQLTDYIIRITEERKAAGLDVASCGPSPGVENLKWVKPILSGDEIKFSSEVLSKRQLKSKPEWGLVIAKNSGYKMNGELAFSLEGKLLLQCRTN